MPVRAALLAGGLAVAGLVAQVDAKPRPPESFWPTTVVGWLNTAIAVGAVVGMLYGYKKFSLAPVQKAIDDQGAHFRGEIKRIERHYDAVLEEVRSESEHHFNAFRGAMEAQLNGVGERVRRTEVSQHEQDAMNDRVIAFMASSETDRRALGAALTELKLTVIDGQKAQAESERRLMAAIMTHSRGGTDR